MTSYEYSIRTATIDDAPALADCFNQACNRDPLEQVCYRPRTVPDEQDQRAGHFAKRLQEGSTGRTSFFDVAVDNSSLQVVGFAEWEDHRSATPRVDSKEMQDQEQDQEANSLCRELVGRKQHYHLEAVYILTSVERRGVAAQLIQHGLNRADSNCTTIFLPICLSKLAPAKGYYLSAFGFVDRSADREVQVGCDGMEDTPMDIGGVQVASRLVRDPMGICCGVGDNQTVQ